MMIMMTRSKNIKRIRLCAVADEVQPTVNSTDIVVAGVATSLSAGAADFANLQNLFKTFKVNKAIARYFPTMGLDRAGLFAMWKSTHDEPTTRDEYIEKVLAQDPKAVLGRLTKKMSMEIDIPQIQKLWTDMVFADPLGDDAEQLPYPQISWGLFDHDIQTTEVAGVLVIDFDVSFR
jgi:hypothetical protein